MEALAIAVGTIALSIIFIVLSSVLIALFYGHIRSYFYKPKLGVAEIRSAGKFQYEHDFFDKIEEFRNDISR